MSDRLPNIAEVAELLTRVGGTPVTEAMILEDIDKGAPVTADGTVNVVEYAAWLAREDLSYVQRNFRRARHRIGPA